MRKKLLINIATTILISSVFLLILSWHIMKNERIKMEAEYINITIEQIKENIESNKSNLEKARELFRTDYINRLNFISYLIEEDNDGILNSDEWNRIISLTEVRAIYIVDKNGIVTQSSKNEAIGINFYDNITFEKFIPLIEGKEEKGYTVIYDGISMVDGVERVYIGIGNGKDGGILVVDADKEILHEYEQSISIKEVVTAIPIRYEETLFVVDKNTGIVIGSSDERLYNVKSENMIKNIKMTLNDPKVISVHGEDLFVLSKILDDKYIVMAVSMAQIMSYVKANIVQYIIIIFIICIVIGICLYRSVKNVILNDIEGIGKKLTEFCEGKNDIVFGKAKTCEMSQLIGKLYKVINAIKTKNERISSIASMMGEGFGAYEYYHDLNQIYMSENLPDLMGMSEEETKDIIKKFYDAENQRIEKYGGIFEEKDEYSTANNKILKIRRKLYKNTVYAFLEDITEQKERDTRLSKELKITKEESIKDTLTELYNRKKIEEVVNEFISSENAHKSIMMLLDLDNFKMVNDTYGHLEGDNVLKKLALILCKQFRNTDTISRLGGDEFLIFINNNISEDTVIRKVDNLLKIIKKELNEGYENMNVSASIGIAYIDESIKTFEEAYKFADEAMYFAKNKGKDCFYINKHK